MSTRGREVSRGWQRMLENVKCSVAANCYSRAGDRIRSLHSPAILFGEKSAAKKARWLEWPFEA